MMPPFDDEDALPSSHLSDHSFGSPHAQAPNGPRGPNRWLILQYTLICSSQIELETFRLPSPLLQLLGSNDDGRWYPGEWIRYPGADWRDCTHRSLSGRIASPPPHWWRRTVSTGSTKTQVDPSVSLWFSRRVDSRPALVFRKRTSVPAQSQHRDLSLEDVLLGANGQFKICDFGLTCDAHQFTANTGFRMHYMASEPVDGTLCDPKKADM